MAKLVIVESPAKAKTIGKYLGKDYEVTASMGHIRDLPKSQLGIDVEHDYAPQYINIKDKSKLIKELKVRKAYFVNAEEKAKLEQYMFGCTAGSGVKPVLNSAVPGKSPQFIAKAAGFEIPSDATILAAECKEVSDDEPLTHEKLAPVQAVLKADNKEQAFEMCEKMLKLGAGHTAAIHTNNQELVREYGVRMHACRIIWNQPSSLGGIGDIYNAIAPSLTLGCGSYGGNSVSGNVQAVNLVNIKRIARRNNNMQWFKIPAKTYFEPNAIKYLRDMYGIEKAVIVCDKVMEQLGIVDKIIDQLRARSNRVTFRIIDYVEPEPSVETVEKGAEMMREEFEPDTIIAVGGGSPMDASKIMWLLYEHPEIAFSDVREKFFDIRKRAFKIPPLGKKAKLVCIPTTAGTGAEVTPNAIVAVPEKELKVGIVNENMIADYVILDARMIKNLPRKIAAATGVDALAHCIECFTSNKANPFSDLYALEGLDLILNNIEKACDDPEAMTEKNRMQIAAYYGGLAITASGTTAVHALSYPLGGKYHIAHGVSNAILLAPVMRFNSEHPAVRERLAIAYDRCCHEEKTCTTVEEKTAWMIARLEHIVKHLDIPTSLKEFGVPAEDLEGLVEAGMQVQRLLVNNMRPVTADDARKLYQEVM